VNSFNDAAPKLPYAQASTTAIFFTLTFKADSRSSVQLESIRECALQQLLGAQVFATSPCFYFPRRVNGAASPSSHANRGFQPLFATSSVASMLQEPSPSPPIYLPPPSLSRTTEGLGLQKIPKQISAVSMFSGIRLLRAQV
jgi:hypothetical protein